MERVQNLATLVNVEHGFYNKHDSGSIIRPVRMRQMHTADVVVVDCMPEELFVCDALVTKTPGLNLVVRTADCAPVLMADPVAGVVAAAHAGWRGAMAGVIENTVEKMCELGAARERIIAGVGPCLGLKNFEVKADFITLLPDADRMMFIEKRGGKMYFDFKAYLIARLAMADVMNVDFVDVDTYADVDYHSYRRYGKNVDHQYSSIMLGS